MAGKQTFGRIEPGYEAAEMTFIDHDGFFLVSNSSSFALGFNPTTDKTLFLLVIMHMNSQKIIWSANRGNPVGNSDKFIFDENGNVLLQKGGSSIWSLNTSGKGVSAVELQDTGNLVLLGKDKSVIWESFSHPTDTLLSSQDFTQGMKLESDTDSNNLTYFLEIKSGDMFLSAGYETPQPYWSMGKESLKTINQDGGDVFRASLEDNSWNIYDESKVLLWQFTFASDSNPNVTWIAVLGSDGIINFYNLQMDGSGSKKIPNDPCRTPESCGAYFVCSGQGKCQCPPSLSGYTNCQPEVNSPCEKSKKLVNPGDGLSYVPLEFLSASLKTDLEGCKSSCLGNCSCVASFYDNSTKNCFLLDNIGSFEDSQQGSGLMSFVKVLDDGDGSSEDSGSSGKGFPRKKNFPESPKDGGSSEEDNFLESLSGMPIRFTYKELQIMMEEGKLHDILDSQLVIDIEKDERALAAVKIALWCIQEDMHLRPSMAKVVQMLEGLSPVSKPPISSPLGMRLYSNVFKSMSEGGTSSGPSDCNSDAFLSAVRLSGPR
ncbi:hypothetical protein ACFE04_014115 [Oxalis oulophora]